MPCYELPQFRLRALSPVAMDTCWIRIARVIFGDVRHVKCRKTKSMNGWMNAYGIVVRYSSVRNSCIYQLSQLCISLIHKKNKFHDFFFFLEWVWRKFWNAPATFSERRKKNRRTYELVCSVWCRIQKQCPAFDIIGRLNVQLHLRINNENKKKKNK